MVSRLLGAAALIVTSVVLALGAWVAAATAAGAPGLTATVKTLSPTSRLVHIVNRDTLTYRNFIVETQNKPQIVAVSKPCVIERELGFVAGTQYRYRYRAVCRKALAPGKTFDIQLTTKGRGPMRVYVVVKGVLTPIDT